MKIIYLFTSGSPNSTSSVQNKVLNQIKYLNQAGAECRGAFFSSEVKKVTPLNEYVDFIPVEKCNWKYFQASGHKRAVMKSVLGFAKKHYKETDLFYVRYPGAGSLLNKFVNRYGNKTVFEHLSIELAEIKLAAPNNPFGLKPSKLLSNIEYVKLPILREKLFGKNIRSKAFAGICNSDDIAKWQNSVSNGVYKTIIGGDAVETSSFKLKQAIKLNDELKMIFLKGASMNAEYNGLDRIFKSMKNYNGKMKLHLSILGKNLEYEKAMTKELGIENMIDFVCFISGKELDNFIDKSHIGISTFGLFRKNLDSTTTIKNREFFARGLPFIYAYTDPDLINETKAFALQFPNDDSLIDMQEVINFAQKVLSDPEHPQKMRKYAEEHLDYSVKMKRLLEELEKVKNEKIKVKST